MWDSSGSKFSLSSLKFQLPDVFVFTHSIAIKDRNEQTKRFFFLLINLSENRIGYPLILIAVCIY